MSSNYPTSLDDLMGNQAYVDGTTIIQAQELNNIQDAIDALQEKVGIDSSGVTTSHDYKLANLMTPASYSGGESVTFPNGLILKMGKTTSPSGNPLGGDFSVSVEFGTAFPNAIISVNAICCGSDHPHDFIHGISSPDLEGFDIIYREANSRWQDVDGFYWMAIGY